MLGIPPTPLFSVHSDSQRPGGMTSTYGRTPMYGSQTPMYGSGSRTPMYGSQTPLQDGKYVHNTRDEAEGSADRTEYSSCFFPLSREPYSTLWLADAPA